MDGVGARCFCCGKDFVDVEITLASGGTADMYRDVCQADVQCIFVRIGIDRNSLYTAFLSRSHNPACNFAAIGDEYRSNLGHASTSLS